GGGAGTAAGGATGAAGTAVGRAGTPPPVSGDGAPGKGEIGCGGVCPYARSTATGRPPRKTRVRAASNAAKTTPAAFPCSCRRPGILTSSAPNLSLYYGS